jgi:hypothetical protein
VLKIYINISGTHLINTLILKKAYIRASAKSSLIVYYKALFKESLNIYCYFILFKENVKLNFKLFNNSYPAEARV